MPFSQACWLFRVQTVTLYNNECACIAGCINSTVRQLDHLVCHRPFPKMDGIARARCRSDSEPAETAWQSHVAAEPTECVSPQSLSGRRIIAVNGIVTHNHSSMVSQLMPSRSDQLDFASNLLRIGAASQR